MDSSLGDFARRSAASPTPLPPLVWAAPAGASDRSVLKERN